MGIQILNGVAPKPGRTPSRIAGFIFPMGPASEQHPLTAIASVPTMPPKPDLSDYNTGVSSVSPNPPHPTGRNTATIPQFTPLKVEQPGEVVDLHKRQLVNLWEHASVVATTVQPRAIARVAGGPSRTADTPSNPNAARLRKPIFQYRTPVMSSEKIAAKSFHPHPGGTLGTVGSADASNGAINNDRWNTVKRGAAG